MLRLQPVFESVGNLITDAAEGAEPLVVGADRARRIIEWPVEPLDVSGGQRATLGRIVADGDHVVPPILNEADEELRGVSANVDTRSAMA